MMAQPSLSNEDGSLAFQLETGEAARPSVATSERNLRFLWTGLGFAALLLIGVACAPLAASSHASATSLRPVPDFATASYLPSVSLPGVQQNQPQALSPIMTERSSRREALKQQAQAGVALAALTAMTPQAARADAVADIAARANAAAAKERDSKRVAEPEPEVSTGDKLKPVLTALGGSVVLSVPFYYKNLQRLATKISSGGEDDGRGGGSKPAKKAARKVAKRGAKAEPEKKGGFFR
jgi:hypothetical protein